MSEIDAGALFRVEGALTMSNAQARLDEGRTRAGAGALCIDFSAVTECDSAALALLLDWIRTARRAGHAVQVRGLLPSMKSLAELYGITELIPGER